MTAGGSIKSLRGIFQDRDGKEIAGSPWHGNKPAKSTVIKAKPGYVVSKIDIRTGLWIDGLSLKFAKLGKDRLILEDSYTSASYTSPHVGGNGGQPGTIGLEGMFI